MAETGDMQRGNCVQKEAKLRKEWVYSILADWTH